MSDNGADNGGAGERPQRTGRARGVYTSAQTRGMDAYTRGRDWVEGRDPATRTGATIGWFKRYRAADGQLYAVLLTAYFFLTMVPLILVETTYVYKNPEAFATRLEHRLKLSGTTSHLLSTVLAGSGSHKLSAMLIAVVNLFFFGVGFGRVLQLVHARSWGLDLRARALLDQSLYYGILVVLALMTFVFVLQTRALRNSPSWIGWVLDLGWLALVIGFFVWAPLAAPAPAGAGARHPARRGLHDPRLRRPADHLGAAVQALAELVLEDVRCARDRDGDLLLADHLLDRDGARCGALTCARPPP